MEANLVEIRKMIGWGFGSSFLPIHLFSGNHIMPNTQYFTLCYDLGEFPIPGEGNELCGAQIWFDPDFPDIFYGSLRISEQYSCVIGPCCSQKLTQAQVHKYALKRQIRKLQITTASLLRVESLLYLLASGLGISVPAISEKENFSSGDEASSEGTALQDYQALEYQLQHTEVGFLHHSYTSENQLKEAFLSGDPDAFAQAMKALPVESGGTPSKNPIKQMEYIVVASVSSYARWAMEAGVDQTLAYNLNDLFLQKLSAAAPEAYQQILQEATDFFLNEIRKVKEYHSESPYIRKCKDYIYRHLNKEFTLADLAEHTGLAPTYLSALFSAQEGITIREYLHRERIHAAENMLRFSDYSLLQISEYFCYCSQSHFSSVFKKYTGETPDHYRKFHRQF